VITESNGTAELEAWLLADPLSLEDATSLAVGRIPRLGTHFPATFTPLLRAAVSAVESGELVPSNDWRSHKVTSSYGATYVEPMVKQADFRAWLQKTLPQKMRGGAYFFLLAPDAWPTASEVKPQIASDVDKPLSPRERTNMLRIIRALDAMAKLPDRGASTAVEKQLETLGFRAPKEATIRKLLEGARGLAPD